MLEIKIRKILIITLIISLGVASNCGNSSSQTEDNKMTSEIRKPAVADAFYPANPVTLSQMIADFFKKVKKKHMFNLILINECI